MSLSESKKEEKLTFEQALENLETIIESMENGNIPLQELVSKFEEGSHLLKYCNSFLNEAELKIEKLKDNTQTTFEPFES